MAKCAMINIQNSHDYNMPITPFKQRDISSDEDFIFLHETIVEKSYDLDTIIRIHNNLTEVGWSLFLLNVPNL